MEIEEFLGRITEGKSNALTVKKELLDGREQTTLVLEQRTLLPEAPRHPARRESQPKAHTFYEVKSFAAYLEKYGCEDTVVFGDPAAGLVTAVLNEIAEDGFEMVSFRPMLHPRWAPWESLIGRKLEVAQFVEFVLNNRSAVQEPDARELVYSLWQIKSTSTTEIQRGRGKESINGIMVTNKIQGVEKSGLVELPDVLKLLLPIYVRTPARVIELDLCIEGGEGTQILCSLSSGGILDAKVEAFEEMFKELEKLAGYTITMGTVAHGQWRYLTETTAKETK